MIRSAAAIASAGRRPRLGRLPDRRLALRWRRIGRLSTGRRAAGRRADELGAAASCNLAPAAMAVTCGAAAGQPGRRHTARRRRYRRCRPAPRRVSRIPRRASWHRPTPGRRRPAASAPRRAASPSAPARRSDIRDRMGSPHRSAPAMCAVLPGSAAAQRILPASSLGNHHGNAQAGVMADRQVPGRDPQARCSRRDRAADLQDGPTAFVVLDNGVGPAQPPRAAQRLGDCLLGREAARQRRAPADYVRSQRTAAPPARAYGRGLARAWRSRPGPRRCPRSWRIACHAARPQPALAVRRPRHPRESRARRLASPVPRRRRLAGSLAVPPGRRPAPRP